MLGSVSVCMIGMVAQVQLNTGAHTQTTALMAFSESPENQASVLGAILNGIDLLNWFAELKGRATSNLIASPARPMGAAVQFFVHLPLS